MNFPVPAPINFELMTKLYRGTHISSGLDLVAREKKQLTLTHRYNMLNIPLMSATSMVRVRPRPITARGAQGARQRLAHGRELAGVLFPLKFSA